jgi:hypothetical protein
MAKTATRSLTDAEREHRRAQQRQVMCNAVEQLRCSEGWRSYLRTRRAFRSYTLVIWRAGVIYRM